MNQPFFFRSVRQHQHCFTIFCRPRLLLIFFSFLLGQYTIYCYTICVVVLRMRFSLLWLRLKQKTICNTHFVCVFVQLWHIVFLVISKIQPIMHELEHLRIGTVLHVLLDIPRVSVYHLNKCQQTTPYFCDITQSTFS